jgi:maltooligosyltrehalose trehalohydrolase
MLFQGQEWAASARFPFFVDHHPELNEAVKKGRGEFMAQFPSAASPEARALVDDPAAAATFEASRLDWSEREREPHRGALALHRDLLTLRREDPTIREGRGLDGAVLGPEAFCLRWVRGEPRLLVVNLGVELWLEHAPEPLLAPPRGARWRTLWSSEHPSYGGGGTYPIDDDERGFRLPGHAAVLLGPEAVR